MVRQSALPSIRLLVVEGQLETAARIRRVLQRAGGYEVVHASSLEQALEILPQGTFDAILLDLFLPDSHGLDTFLRLVVRAPHVPIVAITAEEQSELGFETVREGAQDYLPISRATGKRISTALQFAIERHRTRSQLQRQSLNDELTGLLNRRGFMSLAEQQITLARRAGWDLSLFFFDLDYLKSINDRFGHSEGDRALRAVADILKETFRASDIIARLGGDEFLALAIDVPGSGVEAIKSRLEERLHRYNQQNPRYRLSLSFGVAGKKPDQGEGLADLIDEADEALYESRRHR